MSLHICFYGKCRSFFADRESADFLSALFDRKLSSYICTYSGINNKICNKITENEIKRIAGSVNNLIFTPEKISSYNNSQVCAGYISICGISLN